MKSLKEQIIAYLHVCRATRLAVYEVMMARRYSVGQIESSLGELISDGLIHAVGELTIYHLDEGRRG